MKRLVVWLIMLSGITGTYTAINAIDLQYVVIDKLPIVIDKLPITVKTYITPVRMWLLVKSIKLDSKSKWLVQVTRITRNFENNIYQGFYYARCCCCGVQSVPNAVCRGKINIASEEAKTIWNRIDFERTAQKLDLTTSTTTCG